MATSARKILPSGLTSAAPLIMQTTVQTIHTATTATDVIDQLYLVAYNNTLTTTANWSVYVGTTLFWITSVAGGDKGECVLSCYNGTAAKGLASTTGILSVVVDGNRLKVDV